MKVKHILVAAAFVGSVVTPAILATTQTFATPAVDTWTGTANDGSMNNAANWSGNAVPSSGDDLVFPAGLGNQTVTNDLSGSPHFDDFDIGTTGSGAAAYTFAGSAFTVGGIKSNGNGVSSDFGNVVNLVSADLHTNAYGITVNTGDTMMFEGNVGYDGIPTIHGDGAISFSGTFNGTGAGLLFDGATQASIIGDNSSFNGHITLQNSSFLTANLDNKGIGSSSAVMNIDATSTLVLAPGVSYGQTFNLTGTLQVAASQPQAHPHETTTLTGTVTLSDGATYSGDYADLQLTGTLNGTAFSIPDGSTGNIIVSAATNNSQTINGTYKPAVLTTTLSDSAPSTPATVDENNIFIIDGARGATTVYAGGTLKGHGTVGALQVSSGANVAPGNSPGCLSSGNLTLNGTYNLEIGGTTACSGYDQLTVTGTVDVTGATLTPALYGGFVPSVGNTFTIISNDGSDAVTGTFSGLAEGSSFTSDGVTYQISYVGGDGNDVVLTVTAVAANAGAEAAAAAAGSGTTPSAPDTGFALVAAHPLVSLIATTLAALGIMVIARRLQPASKR